MSISTNCMLCLFMPSIFCMIFYVQFDLTFYVKLAILTACQSGDVYIENPFNCLY